MKKSAPNGTVTYEARSTLTSKRALRRGDRYDFWKMSGGVVLLRHPGLLEKLFAMVSAIFALLLSPLIAMRRRVEEKLQAMAGKLGALFAVLAIPLAFLTGIADALALIFTLARRLPQLLFSPIALIREIVFLPFRIMLLFVARAFWAFMLPWLSQLLESSRIDAAKIAAMLQRYPWLRGCFLGFLRRNRPEYPIVIPTDALEQTLTAERSSLSGKKLFFMAVEGTAVERGFARALTIKLKEIVLPFYWERTVHVISNVRGRADDLMKVDAALGARSTAW